jgi:hypothetical protein
MSSLSFWAEPPDKLAEVSIQWEFKKPFSDKRNFRPIQPYSLYQTILVTLDEGDRPFPHKDKKKKEKSEKYSSK